MSSSSTGAAPRCPSSATEGVPTSYGSSHSWNVFNDTDTELVINLEYVVSDSFGHSCTRREERRVVTAQGSLNGGTEIFPCTNSYPVGSVQVIARTTISGDISNETISDPCSFSVDPQQDE